VLATEVLRDHHDEIRALMARLADIPPQQARQRRQLLDVLMSELTLHEMVEDKIFYPATTHVSAIVPIAHAEHRQLSDQLATLLRTPEAAERFSVELGALRSAVEQHAGKEERDMFSEVRAKVDEHELERLGDELARYLAHLRRSPWVRRRLALKRAFVRRTPASTAVTRGSR
jgi:hypothetical protein